MNWSQSILRNLRVPLDYFQRRGHEHRPPSVPFELHHTVVRGPGNVGFDVVHDSEGFGDALEFAEVAVLDADGLEKERETNGVNKERKEEKVFLKSCYSSSHTKR